MMTSSDADLTTSSDADEVDAAIKNGIDGQCRTVYFVLQLGPSASYIFDKECSGPFVITMDLYIDEKFDNLANVCEQGPYEQLRVYCQAAKDYEFYAVDDSKKKFRLLTTREDLAEWLLCGAESRLYTQPRIGFELDSSRIESLLKHWENNPFVWEDVDNLEIVDVMKTTGADC